MKYFSLFSGAGGLELKDSEPIICCEIDFSCHSVLKRRFPNASLHSDVRTLDPPKADLVVGGWPCQDISVAGKMAGLDGTRSGLFFELLRVAKKSRAHSIIAENVPNLLKLNSGRTMLQTVEAIHNSGWSYVAWRLLNARAFGLPQQRRRLFIVASKHKEIALNLFRPLTRFENDSSESIVAGFYTTAGSRSLCYSLGFVPTLKVGSSISIPSPPGIHYGSVIRKATAAETIRFQGFEVAHFEGVKDKDIYRMMGNAVAVPAGEFATATCISPSYIPPKKRIYNSMPSNGFYDGELHEISEIDDGTVATNLDKFIDYNVSERLSQKAASGILRRLNLSGTSCNPRLYDLLVEYAEAA